MKRIRDKLLLLSLTAPVVIVLVMSFIFLTSITNLQEMSTSVLDTKLREDFDLIARNEIDTAITMLDSIQSLREKGIYDENEARYLSENLLRGIRYGESGYIFALEETGIVTVLLGGAKEGTNMMNDVDANGTYYMKELIEKAFSGGGYTNYWFPKAGETEASPKRSYSQLFKPYNWTLGTGNYVDDIDKLINAEKTKQAAEVRKSLTFVFSSVFIMLFVTAAVSIFVGNKMAKPIVLLSKAAEEVALGNLVVSIDTTQKDEVGNLSRALSDMIEKLKDVTGNVKTIARQVSSGSGEISNASQSLSSGAAQQASGTEEVSSSVEELYSNIQQNTENAVNSEKIAKKVAENAEESWKAVSNTVEAMGTIAEKIGLIEDIARNTNMLALNAAIEAARAGDVGKGFAVVAAEVRKLAENSQKAASEITEIASMSLDTAKRAGDLINTLVPDVKQTSILVQEISSASTEQSKGAEQINNAIMQLDQVIQENAASSEELSSMSEELASQSENMLEAIGFFRNE